MKKIAVLFGGNSDEKEVSLHTGLAVIEAIKEDYDITSINMQDDYSDLYKQLIDIDVVFIALHGGYGEDGRLQKYLNKHNIKYTGSDFLASSIAMDKNKTKIIAKKHGVPIIEWEMANKELESINTNLEFPLIIKPNDGGSTIGIYYVENIKEFKSSLLSAFSYSDNLMIEKYIKGREISVPILGDQVLPLIEIVPSGFIYDYDSKYKSNGSEYIIPAKIDDNLIRLISNSALSIYNEIGCRHYARIDFLLKDNKYFLLEVNTLPGLTSTSLLPKSAKFVGLSYKELVRKIIELAD